MTVIEILSPSNKVSGSRGQASYEQKREQVLNSPTHFIEIDLLREGEADLVRGTAPAARVPDPRVAGVESPPGDGLAGPAGATPAGDPGAAEGGDADVSLDLQALLMSAYERAGYDLSVDYSGQPEPPLPPEWSAWADRLLKEKGLRPPGEAQ
ncbi:MAG: DUF4058 family protein [Isosphaeraceae bacterium]